MKRLLIALVVMVLCTAYILPPELPSCFWGYAVGIPAGSVIEISAGGHVLAQAKVQDYGGIIAYQVDVTGGIEGAVLQFKYNGAVVGTGIYHTGTNQQADLVRVISRTIKRLK
jgi:hypothetical protein